MKRRTLIAGSAALAAAPLAAAQLGRANAQAGKTTITWWHAMTGVLAEEVNRIAREFNASQAAIEVQPIYKGSLRRHADRCHRRLACQPGAAPGADL